MGKKNKQLKAEYKELSEQVEGIERALEDVADWIVMNLPADERPHADEARKPVRICDCLESVAYVTLGIALSDDECAELDAMSESSYLTEDEIVAGAILAALVSESKEASQRLFAELDSRDIVRLTLTMPQRFMHPADRVDYFAFELFDMLVDNARAEAASSRVPEGSLDFQAFASMVDSMHQTAFSINPDMARDLACIGGCLTGLLVRPNGALIVLPSDEDLREEEPFYPELPTPVFCEMARRCAELGVSAQEFVSFAVESYLNVRR